MDTEATPPGPEGTDTEEPGPRLARTLAEQAEAKKAGRRRSIGIAVAIIGVIVIGLAAWSMLSSDGGSDERNVGKLDASHLDGDAGESASGTKTTTKGDKTTTTTAGKGAAAKKKHWPGLMWGRPKAFGSLDDEPGDAGNLEDGYYVWNDFDGFHLWQVGGGDGDSVTLTIDDPMAKADAVGGDVDLVKTANSFTLKRGGADGKVIGVEFAPGFYSKNIIVAVDGGKLALHLGSRAKAVQPFYGARYEATS